MGMGTWGITEYTISREKLHELLPEQVEEVEAIDPSVWSIAARSLEVYTDPLHITEDDEADVIKDMHYMQRLHLEEADCWQIMKKLKNLCHDFNLVTGLVLNPCITMRKWANDTMMSIIQTGVCSCWKARHN